jgi:hypothetical protein
MLDHSLPAKKINDFIKKISITFILGGKAPALNTI